MTTAIVTEVAGSVLAVAVLVALCWMLGFGKPTRIAGEDQVRALAAAEAPGATISAIALDAEGAAAAAELCDGRVLALQVMGDKIAARVMSGDSLRVTSARNGRVHLSFADFAFPGLTLRLGPGGLPDWLARRI